METTEGIISIGTKRAMKEISKNIEGSTTFSHGKRAALLSWLN